MSTSMGTILIADDEMLNRMLLRVSLQEQGFTVYEVENGREALDFLQDRLVDILLLDLLMPEMDGFEVLAQLKADERLQHIPILIISASERMEDVVRCIEMGATDYLPKPFDPVLLRARVNASMNMKRMRDLEREYTQTLQAQNLELDAFARTVAHDLKTPITPIIGYAELLADFYADDLDDRGRQLLQMIVRNGRRMANIIDALLLLARLRNELPPLDRIDMEDVIKEVLDRLEHVREQYNGTITLQSDWPVAIGYASWIEEVWANYLSNALKYGGEPPQVELGATQIGPKIRFWVKDHGPGIPLEKQKELFTAFNRLDHQGADGHGLGLSIVLRIIEKLDGEVGVDSHTGDGCTFWFTLPAAALR